MSKTARATAPKIDWRRTHDDPPAEGVVVMTKISDEDGDRNEAALKRQGRLWFTPDGEMYVYYTPTHWRRLTLWESEE